MIRHFLRRSLSTSTNPLLAHRALPNFKKIDPSLIEPAVTSSLKTLRTAFEQVELALPNKTSAKDIYSLAVDELERAGAPLSYSWGITNHLVGVKTNAALRETHEELQPLVVAEVQRQSQSQILFDALNVCMNATDYNELDSAQQRIVASSLQDMDHAGVGLPQEDRQRFNALKQEIATLSTSVQNNVLDSTKSFRLEVEDKAQLSGLPPTALALAASMHEDENATAEHGPWTLTLDMPSLLPALQHLDNQQLREKLYRASRTVASSAPHDNTPHITHTPSVSSHL